MRLAELKLGPTFHLLWQRGMWSIPCLRNYPFAIGRKSLFELHCYKEPTTCWARYTWHGNPNLEQKNRLSG
jgi:hypothetical protein